MHILVMFERKAYVLTSLNRRDGSCAGQWFFFTVVKVDAKNLGRCASCCCHPGG
jgi:hypothetical protein